MRNSSSGGRFFRGIVFALALGIAASVGVVASPAQAADPSWWFSKLKVADAHAAGFTGKGVKIAVIDGQIDPSSPAFAGANVTVNSDYACKETPAVVHEDANTSVHGTRVTQLLVRPGGVLGLSAGIAPDAQVMVYLLGDLTRCEPERRGAGGEVLSAWTMALDRAVADGANVISISIIGGFDPEVLAAIARTQAAGVVIVAGTRNREDQTGMNFPNASNGVVSVSAIADTGDLQSDLGAPVVEPEVTVVAPGVDIASIRGTTGSPILQTTTGSSLATPLVAGALALAKQKFPKATGNQLIQALIHSTASAKKGLPRDTSGGYGYGMVSLSGLLASDVMSFPDVNPLMDKQSGQPTAAEVEAAKSGKPTSAPQPSASTPAPSASDSTPTPSASVPASAAGSETNVVPYIAGGVVAALGVGILVFVIVRYRRHSTQTK